MKVQDWIFSIRYAHAGMHDYRRRAIVGPARASTVESVLRLAGVPEKVRVQVRADVTVCKFVDGLLDPEESGYYTQGPIQSDHSWHICIGSVQEVLQ